MILDINYFSKQDTPNLAYNLIGKALFRNLNGITKSYIITEVEAYHGFEDKACHARFGKTARNKVIFAQAGYSYVYLCYGIHWLLNIVTGPEGFPAAILIRGIDNTFGPGLVTRKLHINGSHNNKILSPALGLWVEDIGYKPSSIKSLPRVGINYAQEYKEMPWRFILNN